MGIFQKIKKLCFSISTFGALRSFFFSGLIASACAIPLLFLFRSIYWVSLSLYYGLFIVSFFACVIFIQLAILEKPERVSLIVLDKMVGVIVALAGVPIIKWRVIAFGFVLFHVLNTLKIFSWYRKVVDHIERIPGVIGVLGADILSGIVVNVILRLLAWVMG